MSFASYMLMIFILDQDPRHGPKHKHKLYSINYIIVVKTMIVWQKVKLII